MVQDDNERAPTTLATPSAELRVAVSGHRDAALRRADRPMLDRRIAEALDRIERAAPADVRPRLVASLAEGADRLVAAAALDRGWPLTAVLPFAADEFANDFAEERSREAYRGLLARADVVIDLPGVRDGAGDGAAYAAANRTMLAGAGGLVALWDGEPARGVGGTAEVVLWARAGGIPVLWITTAPPHAIRVFLPACAAGTNEPAPWWDRLSDGLDADPS